MARRRPDPEAVPSVRPFPLTVSVDGYQVISGHRFVEIRVHRNQLQAGSSFAWWTEPATAKEGVDYVHQGKAIQTSRLNANRPACT